jgi:hypothetical protein
MTEERALEELERIRAMAGDDESAHSAEDDFRAAVLMDIANGAPNAKELAAIALRTEEIDFARWCA